MTTQITVAPMLRVKETISLCRKHGKKLINNLNLTLIILIIYFNIYQFIN